MCLHVFYSTGWLSFSQIVDEIILYHVFEIRYRASPDNLIQLANTRFMEYDSFCKKSCVLCCFIKISTKEPQ